MELESLEEATRIYEEFVSIKYALLEITKIRDRAAITDPPLVATTILVIGDVGYGNEINLEACGVASKVIDAVESLLKTHLDTLREQVKVL